jgi:hypothetical protein
VTDNLTSSTDAFARPNRRVSWIRVWGVFGVVALLIQALWRLTPIAWEPIAAGSLGAGQAAIYIAWVVFNGYLEGYRAFQKKFAPRVVVRAFYLSENPRPLHVILAPLFCMGLFHANARVQRVAWLTVVLIVAIVIVIERVPQPWRGIVDGGVVIGLLWGVVALVYFFARARNGRQLGVAGGLPGEAAR